MEEALNLSSMEQGDYSPCPEPPEPFVNIVEDGFGFVTDELGNREIVRRYTFTNQNNLIIQVITYGASITSIKFPDKNGVLDDIVLGFDDLEGYLSPANTYFGATIGRCANRIAKGHFKIGDADFQLSTNIGEHHLHGGFKGFDKANWKADIQDKKVVMTYLSKDGEEGYPGEVLAFVSYEMTTDNDLIIEMKATSSKATPINLTNHSYFNLAGHGKGAGSLYQHIISINADKFCHTDENFIPSGMLKNVVNTFWDLRIGRKIGSGIFQVPYGGYDQNMCIHKTSSECVTFIARVIHPESGRTLEIYSNQPGVQFYTSNHFPSKLSVTGVPDDVVKEDIKGKQGVHYYKHQAFCLETQNYPDAINHNNEICQVRKCPVCGQMIRDPDFEMPDEEKMHSESSQPTLNPTEEIQRYIGKDGVEYFRHAAFCLMTQKYPDSVHRKNFPNCVIKPGECYYHIVKYKFDLVEEAPTKSDEEEQEEEVTEESEVEGEVINEEIKADDDLLETKLEENGR